MNKRIVPLKNYLILILLFIGLIFVTYYLIDWYNEARKYSSNSLLNDFFYTVKLDEVDSYLVDNPNTVIYLADSYDHNNDDFEEDFKQYVIENNIKKEIIFIDNHNNKGYATLEQHLSEHLKNENIGIVNDNNILVVKDGKITDILYKNNDNIKLTDVVNFLSVNGVEND